MNGIIWFKSIEELAEFLKAFTGSTACFEVEALDGVWRLKFTGNY
jgi:hypothetical protein